MMSCQCPDVVWCQLCHIFRCLEINSKDKLHRFQFFLKMLKLYVLFDVSFIGVDEFADFEHVILNHVIQLDRVVSISKLFILEILFWEATILEIHMRIHVPKTVTCNQKVMHKFLDMICTSCKHVVNESWFIINQSNQCKVIDTKKTTSIWSQYGS